MLQSLSFKIGRTSSLYTILAIFSHISQTVFIINFRKTRRSRLTLARSISLSVILPIQVFSYNDNYQKQHWQQVNITKIINMCPENILQKGLKSKLTKMVNCIKLDSSQSQRRKKIQSHPQLDCLFSIFQIQLVEYQ